jgi:hypothetical protein
MHREAPDAFSADGLFPIVQRLMLQNQPLDVLRNNIQSRVAEQNTGNIKAVSTALRAAAGVQDNIRAEARAALLRLDEVDKALAALDGSVALVWATDKEFHLHMESAEEVCAMLEWALHAADERCRLVIPNPFVCDHTL